VTLYGDNTPDPDFNEENARRRILELEAKRDELLKLQARIIELGGKFYESDYGNAGVNTFFIDHEIEELQDSICQYGPYKEWPNSGLPQIIMNALSMNFLDTQFVDSLSLSVPLHVGDESTIADAGEPARFKRASLIEVEE
jgi:hypothetical protein